MNYLEKKLLPAVTLEEADSALSVAEALLESGLDVMEITFRTDATAEAIQAIVREFPEITIGAGTILHPDQIAIAMDAGAQFGLAPGFNERVVDEARKRDFPFIPGVMTSSEIEKALEKNLTFLKLFPADKLGGPDYIRSLQGPYGHTGVTFMPMGGIGLSNLSMYLELPVVQALGGSWMTPLKLIKNGEYGKIKELVSQSLAIVRSSISET
ncbi:MAG: bifunctional 4-hydroxy-2-oxoglutarate aldolase/2-dehydro-3-deoxy-phosphogluconate aldolase [Balneolales bacterium]